MKLLTSILPALVCLAVLAGCGEGVSTPDETTDATANVDGSADGSIDSSGDTGVGVDGVQADTVSPADGVVIPPLPGPSGGAFVSAGGIASSPSYKLLFTVGQPAVAIPTSQSSSYRLQGGLISTIGGNP